MDQNNMQCIICKESTGENVSRVRKKGALTLLNAANFHKDPVLQNKLKEQLDKNEERLDVTVHASCRKAYTDLRKPSTSNDGPPSKKSKSTRSLMGGLDWKTCCMFCAEGCLLDERNKSRNKGKIRRVETVEMRNNILERCKEEIENPEHTTCNKFVKSDIRHRMLSCFDLVAAEAVYHKNCHTEFFKTEVKPLSQSEKDKKTETFNELCETLEFLAEPTTLSELRQKIVKKHGEENVYSKKWLKNKLKGHYEDAINFTEDSYSTIISLKNVTSSILNEKWYAK